MTSKLDQRTLPSSADQQSGEPGDVTALPVGQQIGEAGRAVVQEVTETQQPPPHELRDLAAQEDMALWAMLMFFAAIATFVVTSFGTLLIWRQVKLTREAVEDTGKATLAMERQNDLTAIAQRAWIILQAEVLKVEVKDNALRLWTIVRAKNIGRSVAQDATLWALVVQGEKKLDRAIEQVRERLESADAFMSPLVPGDEKQHWNQPSWSIAHLELTPETQRAPIFIFAGVRYTVPGDPERKVTERAFSINQGEASNPFGPHGLVNPPDGWLKLEHLAVHPAGQTRAT